MARQSLIDRLARQLEPKLRRAFLNACYRIRERARTEEVAAALAAGNLAEAVAAVGIEPAVFRPVTDAIEEVFDVGGQAVALKLPRNADRMKIIFDWRNPRAEEWLQSHSSALVQEIVEDQRVTVQQFLRDGMERGVNPRTSARQLVGKINRATGVREGGPIGLHSEQERWLRNYRRDLADPERLHLTLRRGLRDRRFDRQVAKAVREGRGLPAELRERMARSYSNRALKWRADNIARTETLTALTQSQREAYEQAFEQGAVRREHVRRFWQTSADERVRDTHRLIPGMNPDGVGFDEPFDTPDGPVMNPPAGPQCRCEVRIRIDHIARELGL